MDFINLHNHSEYSLLDGMISPEEMIDYAKENSQEAIAITDHGVMGGYLRLIEYGTENDIKPLVGVELYLVKDLDFQEHREKGEKEERFHLTAIAKTQQGMYNLFKLTHESHVEGFYYKPRVDMEMIDKYKEGIIWMSGCLSGPLGQLILDGKEKTAHKQAKKFKDFFNDFYIEIQPNAIDDQKEVNPVLVDIAKKQNIPLVATTDAHYLESQKESHPVLLGIQSRGNMWSFDDDKFYLMTGEQMYNLMKENHPKLSEKDIKNSIKNTVEIADKCDWVEKERYEDTIPAPYPELEDEEAEIEYMRKLIDKGWKMKNMEDKKGKPEYQERLQRELEVIERQGFVRYFLVVHDLYENFVKPNDIMYGTGRGSSAGSLVCCLLDITTPDPIKYGLMFERFISPNRVHAPDIDMDFEDKRREEIKQYFIDKYGRDYVAEIGTYGTMKGKQVLRDVSRVFDNHSDYKDIPKGEVDKISKFIIQRSSGDARASNTLEDSFEEFEECKKFDKKHPEILKHAKNLEGRIRQGGIHAAGVIVSDRKLADKMPLEIRGGQDGKIVTALDWRETDRLGFLKLDVLGLNTLSVIKDAMDEIELTEKDFEEKNIELDFPKDKEKIDMRREHLVNVNYNDPKVLQKFGEGDTEGVFQFNSVGMSDTLKDMPIEGFEDLVALNALYRPGGMRSGIAHDYIDRRKGEQEVESIHPIYDRITKDTLGLIVYQEQVMKIFSDMANRNAIEVNKMREKVAKSHGMQSMQEEKKGFIEGCQENGLAKEKAEDIFQKIVHFGSYAFNRSHAIVYTQIAYWTQWLKVYYPLEFFVASLNNEDDDDDVRKLLGELEKEGYDLLLPHINKSKQGFSVEEVDGEKKIRCGLRYIKGIGQTTADEIVEYQPYENEDDILNNEDINRRIFHKGIMKLLRKVDAWKDNDVYEQDELDGLREFLAGEELYPLPVLGKNIKKAKQLAEHYNCDFTDIENLDFSRNNFVYLRGVFNGINYARIGDFGKPNKYSKWEVGDRYVMMDMQDGTAHIRVKFNPEKYKEYKDKLRIGQKVLVHARILKDIKMAFVDFMVVLSEEKVKEHEQKYSKEGDE